MVAIYTISTALPPHENVDMSDTAVSVAQYILVTQQGENFCDEVKGVSIFTDIFERPICCFKHNLEKMFYRLNEY